MARASYATAELALPELVPALPSRVQHHFAIFYDVSSMAIRSEIEKYQTILLNGLSNG